MSSIKDQELIIVKAISQMVIPSEVFESSQFKDLISNLKGSQEKVESSLSSIESARKAVEGGNFLGNLVKSRKSKLQDAQMNLTTSIGELTKRSSDLVLFNTAISKVLVSQQNSLHTQQELLQQQASELALQNKSIREHQVKISEAQIKIEETNKGLLKAVGITEAQAIQLIDCVERVEAAEQKMEYSNQELERSIINSILAAQEQTTAIKADVDDALYNFRQEATLNLAEVTAECKSVIEGLRGNFANIDLKMNAESETRKLAVTSLTEEFNQRINGLQNQQVVSDKKLLGELDSAKEIFASQIASQSSNLDKYEIEAAERNKKLLYFSVSALLVSVLSLVASAYVFLGA